MGSLIVELAGKGKPKGGDESPSGDGPGAAAKALVAAIAAVKADASDANGEALHEAIANLAAACEGYGEEDDDEDEI